MNEDKAEQVKILIFLQAAVEETGSYCAASALYTLCKLYDVYLDDSIFSSGVGICLPCTRGELYNAYVGVCQFLSVVARYRGLGKKEILSLCQKWTTCFSGLIPQVTPNASSDAFAAVLNAACDFLQKEGAVLQLETIRARPKQYYDQILTDREAMFRHSPYALEEKLSKAVTKGDRNAAVAALKEISRQGDKAVLAKDPLRSAKNSMIGSIAFLARATIQAGVNADKAFALSDSLTQHVEDMTSPKSVLAFEETILLQFIDLVNARLENAYSVSITRVMHYIENNLNKKVTLKDAAAYAGIHPAYLSTRFKKETGQDFSAFVSRRKIQESTYFVRHTHYSVSQIALLYGFSSQSYYITTFKRIMEMTPKEYRSRYLSK